MDLFRKKIASSAAILLLFTVPAECSEATPLVVKEAPESIVCMECSGHETTIRKKPSRVIICYASLIGVWYCAGGSLVGMPSIISSEALPEAARNVDTIGTLGNPSTEKILSLKPDLVIFSGRVEKQRALAEILRQNKIDTLTLEYENYTDFKDILDLFCRINGSSIDENRSAKKIISDVDKIIKGASLPGGPRFLCLMGSVKDVSAETSKSNTAMMAKLLGGKNIIDGLAGKDKTRIKLSMEKIMIEDPDIILITTMGRPPSVREYLEKELFLEDAWKNLKAVKTGRIHFLPNELFLYKANERFPEAFGILADLMYPEREKK